MPAAAQDLTGTLKKVKDTGAITIGYRDSSVPFSYLDGDQKPVGYALEICQKIAEAVKTNLKLPNLEVKLNPVTSATRIPLIANGTIDLECGSTTNNADRQKQASFTNTHFLTATRFVAKKSAKLDKIDDLKGKTVAPFNTHAGYGVGSGFEEINRLCKGCRVTPGLSLQGGRERDGILFVMEGRKAEESRAQVRQWLSRLK